MDGTDRFIKLNRVINLAWNEQLQAAVTDKSFRCRVQNQADGSVDLLIYGYVGDPGDGLDAQSVVEFLAENKNKPIRVRISSPGGLAFDGITIHNALIKHEAPVTVEIEGMAGSSAAVIAMAGNTVRIAGNASLFIHRAWGIGVGNALDMIDLAEFLEVLDNQIAATFAAKSGQSVSAMLEAITGKRDGTTYDAKAALEAGLVDEIMPIRPNKVDEQGGTDNNDSGTDDQDSDNNDDASDDAMQAAAVAAEQKAALQEAANERFIERQRLWELSANVAGVRDNGEQ